MSTLIDENSLRVQLFFLSVSHAAGNERRRNSRSYSLVEKTRTPSEIPDICRLVVSPKFFTWIDYDPSRAREQYIIATAAGRPVFTASAIGMKTGSGRLVFPEQTSESLKSLKKLLFRIGGHPYNALQPANLQIRKANPAVYVAKGLIGKFEDVIEEVRAGDSLWG